MFSPPQLKAMHFGLHSQLRGIYCSKEQVTLAHWSHSYWYARLALSFVSFWNTRTRPQSEQVFTFSARLSRIFGELFERARRRAPPLSLVLLSACAVGNPASRHFWRERLCYNPVQGP